MAIAFALGWGGVAFGCGGVILVLSATQPPPSFRPGVTRRVEGEPFQGRTLRVFVSAEAGGDGLVTIEAPLPTGFVAVRQHLQAHRGIAFLVQEVQARTVGEVQWPPVEVSVTDPWGLQRTVTRMPAPAPFVVLPDPSWAVRGRRLGLSKTIQRTVRAPMASERSLEIERVRDAQPGDPLRDIDWKTTSRMGSLQTRERERHVPRPVHVVLDASAPMRIQRHDCKISSAARVAHGILAAAVGAGTSSSLVVVQEGGCTQRPVHGLGDGEAALLEALAACPPLDPEVATSRPIPAAPLAAALAGRPGLRVLIVDAEADPGFAVEALTVCSRSGPCALVMPATAAHMYVRSEARGRVRPAMRQWWKRRKRVELAARRLGVPTLVLRPDNTEETIARLTRLLP
ncbi:MAG: DUF58 domain-containing protein [Thermoplasmatota archaeon]